MARCPHPWGIDTEVGELSLDQLGREPLMHYMRYDAILRGKWLAEKLNINYPPDMLDAIRKFDRPDLADEWIRIGQAAADVQIDEKHFPRTFDLPVLPAAPEEPA